MTDLTPLLRSVFGFDAFRPGQEEIVSAIEAGRDVLSRVLHGARTAVIVGLGAVALAMLVGVPVGVASLARWPASRTRNASRVTPDPHASPVTLTPHASHLTPISHLRPHTSHLTPQS